MKNDLEHKRARMGEHVPGFPGYSAVDPGETDRLLRRLLTGELENLRDRLAGLTLRQGAEAHREEWARLLRETAAFKDEVTPVRKGIEPAPAFPRPKEERLLEFDLALMEKIRGLHTPIDSLERASSEEEVSEALDFYGRGLEQVRDLFRQRQKFFGANGSPAKGK